MTAERPWELLAKKLSGEATVAELEELSAIQNQNQEFCECSSLLEDLWQQSPSISNAEAETAFEKHKQRMQDAGIEFYEEPTEYNDELVSKPRRFSKAKILAGIFVLAGAISFAFYITKVFTQKQSKFPVSQVSTRPGSRTQIQLPDGSTVWLNASSKITYDENFGKNLREVSLTGEAFFDVVKDPAHPFVIHTKVIDVKVLGTSFNVKAYPEDAHTETSLIRGKVEVTVKNRGNEKYYLKPNEKFVISNSISETSTAVAEKKHTEKPVLAIQPLTYNSIDSAIVETSWVDNRLIFQENETFKEVAAKMERWYAVKIHFESDAVANYRIYGSFTRETITQALDALKIGFRFNYKINGEEITITQ